jgi:hypothetical protein
LNLERNIIMTIADSGGFDIVTDITSLLASRVLGSLVTFPSIMQDFGTPEVRGTANIEFTMPQVQFEPGEMFVVRLSLDTSNLLVAEVTDFGPIPSALQRVPIAGTVQIRDTLDAIGRNVDVDTVENPSRMTPDATVELDRAMLLRAPIVELYTAIVEMMQGPDAAMRAREELISTATTVMQDQLRNYLVTMPIRQTLLAFPQNFAPGTGVPDTRSPIAIGTPTATLRIGLGLGGLSGAITRITRSNIGSGDMFALIVSNGCLLRDLIRPNIDRLLGLSGSGIFIPDDPFLWTGRRAIPIPGVGTLFITDIAVFVDEGQRLILTGSASATLLEGAVSVAVSLRIPVSFTMTTDSTGLTVTLTPGAAAVTSSRVDVAWWVYVAAAFGGGPLLIAALAIADAVADGAIASPIAGEINRAAQATTFQIPLPAGVPQLRVTGTSLFQADAPRRTIRIGTIPMPAAGRDHDLVVRLA